MNGIATVLLCMSLVSQQDTRIPLIIPEEIGTQGRLLQFLLYMPPIQNLLGIDQDKLAQLKELENIKLNRIKAEVYTLPRATDEEASIRSDRFVSISSEVDLLACELLTANQRRRLLQIDAQMNSLNQWWESFLTSPQSIYELELTRSQIATIRAKEKVRRTSFWQRVDQYFTDVELRIRDRQQDLAANILTEAQQDKYDALFGKPFFFVDADSGIVNAFFKAVFRERMKLEQLDAKEVFQTISPTITIRVDIESYLLRDNRIQAELGINDEQRDAIDSQQRSVGSRMADYRSKLGTPTDDAGRARNGARMREHFETLNREVLAVLSPRQQERLRQLRSQYEVRHDRVSLGLLSNLAIQDLQLSSSQQEAIQTEADAIRAVFVELFKSARSDVVRNDLAAHDDLLTVLNDTQRAKYDQVFGEFWMLEGRFEGFIGLYFRTRQHGAVRSIGRSD